jgi:ketosteroid isomerase-like protein
MNADLPSAFVAALADPDPSALRALLAPTARFWVNIGELELSTDQRLALLERERSHLRALEFEDVRTRAVSSGFVVQATTVMTTTDAAELRVPVCLVATTDDGVITAVDEYADSAAVAHLLELLAAGDP